MSRLPAKKKKKKKGGDLEFPKISMAIKLPHLYSSASPSLTNWCQTWWCKVMQWVQIHNSTWMPIWVINILIKISFCFFYCYKFMQIQDALLLPEKFFHKTLRSTSSQHCVSGERNFKHKKKIIIYKIKNQTYHQKAGQNCVTK